VLSVAKLARGREEYYLATLATGREDSGGLIEADGRWLGRAAETLGLSGTVDSAVLRALLTGVDPATGEVLSLRHAQVRVVAYDCTYSTPKSVSLLHALGPEEIRAQVRAGHEEAAAAALGYLERHGARVRRRSSRSDSASSIPAGGLVAAAFLHRTSRAPDPHLHSHVLVANLAPGPDSRWSALDGRGLYLEFATARDLYETQLRGELTGRLGVSWRELQGAWADLAGIDPNLSRAFSRRSIEIEAALEQSGRSGRRARQIASVKTRPEKDLATSYEELVSGWRERSYKLGVSDGRLASVAGRGVPTGGPSGSANAGERSRPGSGRPSKSLSGLPELWASKVLGEHGAVARDGVCRRGELVRSRCASLPFGAPVAEVERDVDALVADGLVVPAPQSSGAFDRFLKATSGRSIPGGAFEPVYTTPEILELHARLESLVRADPGAVELLAYPPGGRLGALDQLGELSSRHDTPITAVAPGRVAAASFEAVTGIETVAVADLRPARLEIPVGREAKGIVVLAEAQRLGPWELSSVIEDSLRGGGRVILFAPSVSLEARFGTAAVLAPHLGAFRSPGVSHAAPISGDRDSAKGVAETERHVFAGREILVAPDSQAARRVLLDAWNTASSTGHRMLVAASDDAVVQSVRDAVEKAGGSPNEVVETRRLAAALRGERTTGARSRIIVLGTLPSALKETDIVECAQVAIIPSRRSETERVAKAAEVARPRYLVSELGPVPSAISDRAAWREGAFAIESLRRHLSIDDPDHAVGDRRSLRSTERGATGEVAETRHKVRQALRSLRRATPSLQVSGPEERGFSR
jgi:conjugative relaxase-like TrwC/TraI family protein